jgi:hypothetical protein
LPITKFFSSKHYNKKIVASSFQSQPLLVALLNFFEREILDTTLSECEGSNAKSTCGTITLVDGGGEPIKSDALPSHGEKPT